MKCDLNTYMLGSINELFLAHGLTFYWSHMRFKKPSERVRSDVYVDGDADWSRQHHRHCGPTVLQVEPFKAFEKQQF